MKKYVSIVLAMLLALTALAGCGQSAPKADVNVTAIAGPTGVGMVSLMEKNELGEAANNYTFNLVSDPQEAVAALSKGAADIAAVPTNLASTLYVNKMKDEVQVLAVNTLGVLYMMENGDSIKSVNDLVGKTIYTSGQGANPEYILRYVLEKNGIDPDKDVKIEFVADNDALTAAVVTGTAQVAMVPEPKVTACRAQAKSKGKTPANIVLDMTAEWDKVAEGESKLMMGCVIARKEFIEANPAAVKAFLKEYKKSIETVTADVEAAATLCEKFKVIPQAAMAKQAIPNCNLVYVDGKDMKAQLGGYLEVLNSYNPKAIGGSVPTDGFYYGG